MAGAYLTIGAKFRPFSYDELMKPVSSMAAMHTAIDEQYAALQEKASVWENLANKETDTKAYQKYKEYSDALREKANELAKNGLNPQSMRDMLNLRARYSSDIVPIEQAYTRRRQLADEQRKMIMQNPTLKFERDMGTTSLDELIENPELDYGYSVNGAYIAQQAGQSFAHLAKTIQSELSYKHILNGYYWQSMTKAGYSPAQILALSINNDKAPEELKAIAKQVYDSTGVEDFINKNYKDSMSSGAQEWRDYVNAYINQGAWNAVGTTAYGTVADPQKQYEQSLELAREKAGLKAGKSGAASSSTLGVRRDKQLIGIQGKTGQTTVHQLGTIDVQSPSTSDFIMNKIAASATNGRIRVVKGYDDNGEIDTEDRKYTKRIDEENDKVTNVQIDYTTGNLYITLKKKGKAEFETIEIPNGRGILDIASEEKIADNVREINAMNTLYIAGKYEKDYADSYIEQRKSAMDFIMKSLLEYTDALNTNTDAGAKRSSAMSVATD